VEEERWVRSGRGDGEGSGGERIRLLPIIMDSGKPSIKIPSHMAIPTFLCDFSASY
jgi:hypothetical protein